MAIFQMLSMLLVVMLLMTMLTQARPWIKAKVPGKVLQTAPLGFIQRLQFFRSSLLALAMGLLMGKAAGFLPDMVIFIAASFALSIVCFPMKYTFTTQGVAIGAAMFRPWNEFSGISLKPRSVTLENTSYFGRLTLYVRPAELGSVLNRIKKTA
jgi:hypothetical protein